MTAAFKVFSDKILSEKDKDKQSVVELMKTFREKLVHTVKDITKHKSRGGPEL